MLGNYALALYRSFRRRPLYAGLNVFGLAIGLATFLVLSLVVRFETGFDSWVPDAEKIYRVNQIFSPPGMQAQKAAATAGVVLPVLRADYPQIEAGVQLMPEDGAVIIGDRIEKQSIELIGGDFFGVFALPLLSGDRRTALVPGAVVLTESLSRKYFGTTSVLGRSIAISVYGRREAYRIGGVLKDLPPNSSLKVDVLVPLSAADKARPGVFDNWFTGSLYTYVKFQSSDGAGQVSKDLAGFVERHAKGPAGSDSTRIELQLTALRDIHFADRDLLFPPRPGADWRAVASLGVVGLLTVLIAALNYVNLASAQSILRAREVAIRKVVGADRSTLLVQFMAEAMLLTLLAGLLAVMLVELSLPIVNAVGGTALSLYDSGSTLLVFLGMTLAVGIVAGAYPAILISRYAASAVLASAKAPGGGKMGSRVRLILVLVQFAVATGFAICTLVVGAQTRHLQEADRGFQREGLILVESAASPDLSARQGAVLATLGQTPGAAGVTLASVEPATSNLLVSPVSRSGLTGQPPSLALTVVGKDFFATYGIRTVAGRVFESSRVEDDLAGSRSIGASPRTFNIVINRGAARALGFSSAAQAVGQTVQFPLADGMATGQIVGVVEDVRFMSPQEPIPATYYLYDSKWIDGGIAAVRFAGVSDAEMMDRLRESWKRVAPDVPFAAETADGKLSEFFQEEKRRAALFAAGSFVTVALGCVGLFGLASFTTTRRVKEVGIRKSLGASTADVLKLMIGEFLKPVLLANLIAWPVSWLILRVWLLEFDDRISLDLSYFLIVSVGAFVLAIATVAEQAYRVARTEPARALRYE